jgi:deoxyribodipyrimidine photo-lyase
MLVTLSEFQEKDEVKEEGKRILKKHVSNPNRKQKKTKT